MLEGVGVNQNRDQYLLRSLQTVGRMEHLIQEMLSIARMESQDMSPGQDRLLLSPLIEEQLRLNEQLFCPTRPNIKRPSGASDQYSW